MVQGTVICSVVYPRNVGRQFGKQVCTIPHRGGETLMEEVTLSESVDVGLEARRPLRSHALLLC